MARNSEKQLQDDQLRALFSRLSGSVIAEEQAVERLDGAAWHDYLLGRFGLTGQHLYALWAELDQRVRDRYDDQFAWLEDFDTQRNAGTADKDLAVQEPFLSLARLNRLPPPYLKKKAPADTKSVNRQAIELLIEPRLLGAPEDTLEAWKTIQGETIPGLLNNNPDTPKAMTVEYYIRSAKPLTKYDRILSDYGTVPGPNGQKLHVYRLDGTQVNAAVAKGYTKNVPFRRFDLLHDPFLLASSDVAQRFGLATVKFTEMDKSLRRKNLDALVVRGNNGDVRTLLKQAGLLPDRINPSPYKHLTVSDDDLSTSIVYPIPGALAASIRRAHPHVGQGEYHKPAQLITQLVDQPELYAPPEVKEKRVAAPSAPRRQREVALDPQQLTQLVLKAYDAQLLARRLGSGQTRYKLSITREPDWKRLSAEELNHVKALHPYRSKQAMSKLIHEQFGIHTGIQSGRERNYWEVAESDLPALASYVDATAIAIRPFELKGIKNIQDGAVRFGGSGTTHRRVHHPLMQHDFNLQHGRSLQRIVHYYLVDQGGVPSFVAVAHAGHFPYQSDEHKRDALRQLFGDFGLPTVTEPPAEFAHLQNAPDSAMSTYMVRLPLDPGVYADLKATEQFAELTARTSKALIKQLGGRADERKKTATQLVAAPRVARPSRSEIEIKKKETTEERTARLVQQYTQTVENLSRSQANDFYLVRHASPDGTLHHHAYAIVNARQAAPLRKALAGQYRADGQPLMGRMFGHGRKRDEIELLRFELTPELYENLRQQDVKRREQNPDLESIQLAHKLDAHERYEIADDPVLDDDGMGEAFRNMVQWVRNLHQQEMAKRALRMPTEVNLAQILTNAAEHDKGYFVTLQLPDAAFYEHEIARLESLVESLQSKDSFSDDLRELQEHATAARMLLPEGKSARQTLEEATRLQRLPQEIAEHLTQQIERLRQLSLWAKEGGTLQGIALRGASSKLGNIALLKKSLLSPYYSTEGKQDPTQRLVDFIELPLGRGHKTERTAYVLVASPPLWNQVAPALERSIAQEEKHIAGTTAYGNVKDAVGEFFEPVHFKGEKPDLATAYRRLDRDALIAYERQSPGANDGKRWADKDRPAQACIYLRIDAHNRRKALDLIDALGALEAVAGEKKFGHAERRLLVDPALGDFHDRAAVLLEARKIARAFDTDVRDITTRLGGNNDAESAFQAKRLVETVEQLAGRFHGELQEFATRDLTEFFPLLETIMESPELRLTLHSLAESGTWPVEGEQRQAVEALLHSFPSLVDEIDQHASALESEYEEWKTQHADALGEVPAQTNAMSLPHHTNRIYVDEAHAAPSTPKLTLVDRDGQTELAWNEDIARSRGFRKQLQHITDAGAAFVICSLTPEIEQTLAPFRNLRGAHEAEALQDRKNSDPHLGERARKHGRKLDALGSARGAHERGYILQQLAGYYGMPLAQEAQSRAV